MKSKAGKLLVSQEKLELIETSVAFHLGRMNRVFTSGELKDGYTMSGDESHFVISKHDDCTLGAWGER